MKTLSRLLFVSGCLLLMYALGSLVYGYLSEESDREDFVADMSHQLPLVVIPGLRRQPAPAIKSIGIGIVEIPRLKISSLIRSSSSMSDLSRGVGHVDGTAMPGGRGTMALAAHRDTFFRNLGGIHNGDTIRIKAPKLLQSYRVVETRIVEPSDVSVLTSTHDRLVLITCYPFQFIGAAPKRFIVIAEPRATIKQI